MKTEKPNVPVNRKYKDTVFRKLFSDKKKLLSLYNALFDTNHENPDDLEIVTLENAIYMKHKDDIACVVDFRVALFEHQSTPNPNMPLRMLRYITDLFEKITKDQNVYGKRLVLLPSPAFIVLYNGVDPQPEKRVLRLSDSYMDLSEGEINLELVVTQLNINDGYNNGLKQKCPELFGYAHFVCLIRNNLANNNDIEKAVGDAIDTCINKGILSDFFKENRKEVSTMGLYEFDEEQYERLIRREEREEEREELLEIAISEGMITPEQADHLRSIRSDTTKTTV